MRRSVIQRWLPFLKAQHPGYRDIEINDESLDALPMDGDLMGYYTINSSLDHGVSSHISEAGLLEAEDDGQAEDEGPTNSALPTLGMTSTIIGDLRNRILQRTSGPVDPSTLKPATMQWTRCDEIPLSEFDRN